MIVVLDNIRSVHNVGSIFRTADGAGVEKIIICGVTPKPTDRFKKIRPDFEKTALGAEKNVKWEYREETSDTLSELKNNGWHIIALEQAKGSKKYSDMSLSKKAQKNTTLVVGNEVNGISKSVLKYADDIIEIPMLGIKESLNVSVAFGIAIYGLMRS